RANISRMVGRVVRNAAFGGQKDAGQLRAQLFPRITLVAEALAFVERRPVQSGRMSRPVRQLMQGGTVVIRRGVEGRLRRKMDAVVEAVVESPVALIVVDLGTGIRQHALSGVDDFELLEPFGLALRHAL